MIFRTAASIYEVHERDLRFRRVHETGASHQPFPIGKWYRFERMSPVILGKPVRFFWLLGEEGELNRIGLWATSAVIAILPDDISFLADDEPSFLVPAQPSAGRAR
jgi:hypothetical protein